ncbi:MAG: hypothetical protein V4450_09750 [Bacteroidota bacterium]
MLKKYAILFGLIISLILLLTATRYYPGGSQYDKNSVGFDWKNNYVCNLFSEKAVNGAGNSSRPWAIPGMLFLCISFALFFIDFSKKIPLKGASAIIRYTGAGAMFFAFLIVTSYHDIMVIISSTLALVSMFYIMVFTFKSKLTLFKLLSLICILVFYCTNYIYYSGSYLAILPVMQKILFAIMLLWVFSLTYFTTREDFEHIKK